MNLLRVIRAIVLGAMLALPQTGQAANLAGVSAGGSLAQEGVEDQIKDKVLDIFRGAGKFSGSVDNLVISPIVSYFTTADTSPDPEQELANREARYNALFLKLMEGLIKLSFPEYAIVIDGGKMIIGGLLAVGSVGADTAVRVGDILADYHDGGVKAAAEKIVFGSEMPVDSYLGNVNELLRMHSFFGTYTPRLGITADNVGNRVVTIQELEGLFKKQYRTYLQSSVFSLPSLRDEIPKAIEQGWPYVLNYWRAQRAAALAATLERNFISAMHQLEPLRQKAKKEAALKELQCSTNSAPLWLEAEQRAVCWCVSGYVWNTAHTDCILEPAAQAKLLQCDAGAEPYWDTAQEKALCRCKPGFEWNSRLSQCMPPAEAQVAAVKCPPNAEAYWDEALAESLCRCKDGYVWNDDHSACLTERQAMLDGLRCPEFYPNSRAIWSEAQNRAICACPKGYRWAAEQTDGCVPDRQAQLASVKCAEHYPGSETVWDEAAQKAVCACKQGTHWVKEQGACLADTPDPDLDKLLEEVADNENEAANADRGVQAMERSKQDKANETDHGPSTLRQQAERPNPMDLLLRGLSEAVVRSQAPPLPDTLPLTGDTGLPSSQSEPGPTSSGTRQTSAAGGYGDEEIAQMQQDLACLKEGRRLYPNAELDCNGSYMIGSRDGHIDRLETALNNARSASPSAPAGGNAPPQRGDPSTAGGGDDWFIIIASALPNTNDNYRNHPECRYTTTHGRKYVSDVAGGKQEIQAAADALRAKGHEAVEVRYFGDAGGDEVMRIAEQWDQAETQGYNACYDAIRRTGATGR